MIMLINWVSQRCENGRANKPYIRYHMQSACWSIELKLSPLCLLQNLTWQIQMTTSFVDIDICMTVSHDTLLKCDKLRARKGNPCNKNQNYEFSHFPSLFQPLLNVGLRQYTHSQVGLPLTDWSIGNIFPRVTLSIHAYAWLIMWLYDVNTPQHTHAFANSNGLCPITFKLIISESGDNALHLRKKMAGCGLVFFH